MKQTSNFKKQQNSKNNNFRKTSYIKKQQIKKKTDIKKTGMKKSVFFCNVSNNVQFCRFVETKYS